MRKVEGQVWIVKDFQDLTIGVFSNEKYAYDEMIEYLEDYGEDSYSERAVEEMINDLANSYQSCIALKRNEFGIGGTNLWAMKEPVLGEEFNL